MPEIAVKPFIMSDVTLKVAADNYEASVSSATLTPNTGTVTWKGLTPESVHTFPQAATWQLDLEFAQDWETEDSLSQYLFEHQGETVAIALTPNAGGKTAYVSAIVVPGSIGGAVDAVATSTVTLGVTGRPSFTAPAE